MSTRRNQPGWFRDGQAAHARLYCPWLCVGLLLIFATVFGDDARAKSALASSNARQQPLAALKDRAAPKAASPTVKKAQNRRIRTAPPPGFEKLTEPQLTIVDVYYGNRRVGAARVMYTSETLKFEEPGLVVAMLPLVKQPAAIIKALTGQLPANSNRICRSTPSPDCGVLRPAVAAVIFNPDRFQVDVFVAPAYLLTSGGERSKFLPPSDAGPSALFNLSGVYADATNAEAQTTLSMGTYLAHKENRIVFDPFYTNQRGFSFNTLSAARDQDAWNYRAGLFQTRGTAIARSLDILGARVGTTTETRIDLDRAFGNQLVVFLSSAAQIDILINGRLISSAFYQAGNQTVDTTDLPEGAFELTLRIRETRGVVREETRFFIKSADIPPLDQPTYFAEFGVLRDPDSNTKVPTFTNTPILRLGTRHRISDGFAVGGSLLTSDDLALVDFSTTYLRPGLRLLAGIGATTENEIGVSANGIGHLGNLSWSLSLRAVRQLSGQSQRAANTFDPFSSNTTSANTRINYRLGAATFGVFGNWFELNGSTTDYAYGPTFRMTLYRNAPLSIEFDASAARTKTETIGTAFLRFSFRNSVWSNSASSQSRYSKRRSGGASDRDGYNSRERVSLSWRDGQRLRDNLVLRLTAESNRDGQYLDGFVDFDGDQGRFDIGARYDRNDGANRGSYFGKFATAITASSGGFTAGGREVRRSALIASVTGPKSDTVFDIIVDGRVAGQVSVGERQIVPLQPYDSYAVSLRPVAGALTALDERTRQVTVYPGNVVELSWSAKSVIVLFGRAIDRNGRPVASARIRGVQGLAITEKDGWFQAEIVSAKVLIFDRRDGSTCRVRLPRLSTKDGIAVLGDVICD